VYRWKRVALLFCFVALLGGCRRAPLLLLYFDPYSFELAKSRGIEGWNLEGLLPEGSRIRIEVPSAESTGDTAAEQRLEELAEIVERRNPRWVYLSSAHPFAADSLASRFPDILFLTEGLSTGGPENQLCLVYKRKEAFHEAGVAVGRLIDEPHFRDTIGSLAGDPRKPRVGILVARSNERIEAQIEAFENGFTDVADPARIERRDIGSLDDRVKARRLLEKMKEEGVDVFLLKTYTLSGFCLDFLQKEGGLAIVDDQQAISAYEDTVLLAMEDDLLGALQNVFDYTNLHPESRLGGGREVEAPVVLQWGKAFSSVVAEIKPGVTRQ